MPTGRRLIAALVVINGACGERGIPETMTVRDSAGVRIVEHGYLDDDSTLRLADAPLYRVGWQEDEPRFDHVVSGVVLSDGRAAIGDRGTSTVAILAADGILEANLGGQGQGPGEIGFLISVSRIGGDTVVVEDDGNGRLSLYHDMEYVGTVGADDGYDAWSLMVIGTDELGLLFQRASFPSPSFRESWLPGYVARMDIHSAVVDTLLTYDWVPNRRIYTDVRFTPEGVVGTTQGTILVGRSDAPEVRRRNFDNTVESLRWHSERPVMTDSLWGVYEEYFMGNPVVTLDTDSRRALFDRMRFRRGEPLPYFGALLGDEEGNVWVADFTTDLRTHGACHVFDPDGSWLGRVSLPPRSRILDIAGGRMLLVEMDDLGVQAIALYELIHAAATGN